MNEQNDKQKQASGNCDAGCACNTTGSAGKTRCIVGLIVLVVAGVLVARAVVKNNGSSTAPAPTGFAALTSKTQSPAHAVATIPSDTNAVVELGGLSELDVVATNMAGVFIFLTDTNGTPGRMPITQINSAARTIESQGGGKIGIFTLKTGSPDYEQVASEMTLPGILVLAQGGGMSTATEEITEAKLVQAFVAASSAGGCGPAAAGCGPSGCN